MTIDKAAAPTSSSYQRDDEYYFEDGSCVLLVDDTLFNVHRTMLSRDSSSFKTMFSLPPGEEVTEGTSDDCPVVLTGVGVSEFRNFLWAIYALPPELKALTNPTANLSHLMDIARISNRFNFESLETWSLDAIQDYVDQKPSPFFVPPASLNSTNLIPCSLCPGMENQDQLIELIRIAQLCNHEKLLNTMIRLLRQLMTTSIQYAYLALTLADELDLRSLRGAAYFEVMHKTSIVRRPRIDTLQQVPLPFYTSSVLSNFLALPNHANNTTPPSGESNAVEEGDKGHLPLTSQQKLRLLAGYYRLTSTWEHLCRCPPLFNHTTVCGAAWHQQHCNQSWVDFWREKTRSDVLEGFKPADVPGRLGHILKEFDRWGSAPYMQSDCRQAARRAIGETIRKIEEALPDFFADADAEFEHDA